MELDEHHKKLEKILKEHIDPTLRLFVEEHTYDLYIDRDGKSDSLIWNNHHHKEPLQLEDIGRALVKEKAQIEKWTTGPFRTTPSNRLFVKNKTLETIVEIEGKIRTYLFCEQLKNELTTKNGSAPPKKLKI